MARLATTSDAFNAVAEPRRRQILTLLTRGERSVGEVARTLRVRQPQASKHLRVLREVGLVRVRVAGRRRLYALHGKGLKPIHDWVQPFERCWNQRLDRLGRYLEDVKKEGRHGRTR
ncbi:MAG: metalloregulator ArsR/SmtB family transcription factor [Gemmatimonadales bacterium]